MRRTSKCSLNSRRESLLRACCAVVAICLVAGCGDGRVAVSGAVTIAGKPVSEGTIAFEPADGNGPSAGGVIRDGRYSIEKSRGVLPGAKAVRVTVAEKTGRQVPAGPPSPPGTMVDEVEVVVLPPQPAEIVAGKPNEISLHMERAPTR